MSESFDQYAIVELMGHVRMAGRVTEEELFGGKLGRIDVPRADAEGQYTTVYFGAGSVYRMTPCTREIADHVAKTSQPGPVSPWSLPQLAAPVLDDDNDDDEPIEERWS